MNFLRQSTQIKVAVGPMVQLADGGTLLPSISWATTEAYLVKNDASSAVDIGTNTWSSHLGAGLYNVTLTASNTDTLGRLIVVAADTAARPARHEFMVVPANVYDSLVLGTDYLQVDATQFNGNATSGLLTSTDKLRADVIQINSSAASGFLNGTTAINADVVKVSGDSTAADRLEAGLDGVVTGVVSTSSTTTAVTSTLTESTNDHYNGRTLTFTSGNLTGQSTAITDYNGSSKTLTVTELTEAPANADTFIIQ